MSPAQEILKSVFGYSSFRQNQEEIISAVLAGRDVFSSMPTGAGKSLCYQVPSLLLPGLSVVISPLIALMKDQVDDAVGKGIPAAYLNSSLSKKESAEIYQKLHRGQIKLLYLSPERLALDGYLEQLRDFNVSFFAIDEAHCLSEWGHDFRPDYLVLSRLRQSFPQLPIAAFTATATHKVQGDIVRILKLDKPLLIRASFDRRELSYQVRPKNQVLGQITSFIKARSSDSGIVYRSSRSDVEKTALHLRSMGIEALPYHAGLSKDERSRNQELFNNDDVQVVVATTAFGMGINKSNIRFVIHGDLPKSMEGYYQETGRAGRDGLDSSCVLYYSTADIAKQQYFIEQIADPNEQANCRAKLNSLVRFATIHVCRRKQILEYFGEPYKGSCGNCDICSQSSPKQDASIDAQKLLSAVARTGEGFGLTHIIDIVTGANTEKIRSRQHQQLKTFGAGRDKSKQWWRSIASELLGQEALYQDAERYNVLRITELGKDILFGRKPFTISGSSAAQGEAPAAEASRKRAADETGYDTELFAQLRKLRSELAHELGLPPYIVFSDKSLRDMALLQPQSEQDFLLVLGVGEKKLEQYGAAFLELIEEYLAGC